MIIRTANLNLQKIFLEDKGNTL